MIINNSAQYWDLRADALTKERSGILHGEERSKWQEALSALLSNDKPLRVLDAGSGSGFLSVILSEIGHTALGIDISPLMVQCAYETASAFGLRIQYRIMDCRNMDFDSESFDAVICCELLSYFQETGQAWKELTRVLKNDGRIIIFDIGAITVSRLQAQGFSHCRMNSAEGLSSCERGKTLNCLSARKMSRSGNIPQIALFNKNIKAAKRQIQLYQSWCQKAGVPYSEYLVLNMISLHSKGVRPSDISSALVIPPQTLTRILSGFKRNGYISRKTSERDQRSSVITLTEEGAEKMRPLQSALREIESKALSEFSADELADLSALNDKLLKSLEAEFIKSQNATRR